VNFFAFHLLIILVVVEFLDDFFGVSLLCALLCIVEKCGGVSFSASAALLLPLLRFSSLLLFLLSSYSA
jgi:hypothetical protein